MNAYSQDAPPFLNPRDEPLYDFSTKDESLEYMESGWPEWSEYFGAILELQRGNPSRRMRSMRIPTSDIVSNWHCQMLAVSDDDIPTRVNSEDYWIDEYDDEEYILVIN